MRVGYRSQAPPASTSSKHAMRMIRQGHYGHVVDYVRAETLCTNAIQSEVKLLWSLCFIKNTSVQEWRKQERRRITPITAKIGWPFYINRFVSVQPVSRLHWCRKH